VLDDLVAVAPGTAFGDVGEGWLRVSLANNEDAVARGVEAIARRCRH
jgi:aspartate/methionine/tyrosine aminotransferase